MLKHVVLFKFKETSTKEEIDNVIQSFLNLKNLVKQIKNH